MGRGGYPVTRRIKPSLTLNSLHSGIDAFTGGILPGYSSCFFRRSVRSFVTLVQRRVVSGEVLAGPRSQGVGVAL